MYPPSLSHWTRVLALALVALLLANAAHAANAGYTHPRVQRTLNLGTKGSNLVYDKLEMDVTNAQSTDAKHYVFQVPKRRGSVIRLKAYQNGEKQPLEYTETRKKGEPTVYTIRWNKKIPAGQSSKLKLVMLLNNPFKPLPESIKQGDDQYLSYTDTFGYKLDGPQEEFTLTIELPDATKPKSFPILNPYQFSGKTIKYGPFTKDVADTPFHIHFQNQQMGLTVENWRREVWIRNFGSTLEFEDHIDIVHEGAKLSGSFSRLELMQSAHRGTSLPVIEAVELRLPAEIRELYYRDDTGNVSTSVVARRAGVTQFLVRPRYLLFGGWRYNWYHGYAVAAGEMLRALGSARFEARVPTVDRFANPDVIAHHHTLTVVLPESALLESVAIDGRAVPYTQSQVFYYFDTTGRTAVHLHQNHVFCSKPDVVTITYSLPPYAYYQKLLAVVAAITVVLITVPILKKIFIGSKR